MKVKKYWW